MKIDADRLRQLCAKGLNRVQIANRLGVTHNAVLKVCKRHKFSVVVAKGYESRVAYFARTACGPIANSGSGE